MKYENLEIALDVETNGLYDWQTKKRPTKIWCAVAIDINSGEVHEFTPDNIKALPYLLRKCKSIIMHNGIKYDRNVIKDILDYEIPISTVEDTLVYSSLLEPKRKNGHGLASWGEYFGIKKPEHEDWTKYSPEMLHRCKEDTKITVKLWKKLKADFDKIGFSRECYEVERLCHLLAFNQQKYGMWLDYDRAMRLYQEVSDRSSQLEKEVSSVFPVLLKPKVIKDVVQDFHPKFTKSGELSNVSKKFLERRGIPLDAGWCTPVYPTEFNIASTQSRVEHLLRLGWTPLEFTDKGSPKVTEESLEDDKLPKEVKLFEKFLIASNRQKIIKNWLDRQDSDGFVHSDFYPIGTWTHRASHSNFFGNPPRVQIKEFEKKKGHTIEDIDNCKLNLFYPKDKIKKEFEEKGSAESPITGEDGDWGAECRDVWRVPNNNSSKYIQIGADASGIQMRAFAHYIKDEDYIQTILSSDIHEYNKELAGLSSRAKAKTFIYAFLLGAGNHKVGAIYDPEQDELQNLKDEVMSARHVKTRELLDYGLDALNIPKTPHNYAIAYRGMMTKNQFIDSLPGLKEYRKKAKPGWFEALDGRKILIKSKHLHLACALQSFESCVMKRVKIRTAQDLNKKGIWFRYVNDVHDEFQIIGEKNNGDLIGQTVVNNIRKVGEQYGSLCPLDGEYKLGESWMYCH